MMTNVARARRYGAMALVISVLPPPPCGGVNHTAGAPAPPPTPAPAPEPAPTPTVQACDETLQASFKPDEQTQVLLVKAFKAGEPLLLSGASGPQTPTASKDVCVVKLLVGPGNPGPADAPSTSAGIGIEVWLPAHAAWNERIHVKGGGGWAGGVHTSTTALAGTSTSSSGSPATTAMVEGAVSASTDAGHATSGGSFAMNPDGTINTTLWQDFSERGIHEMAVKTKALARAYYGRDARRSYWNGFSTGGRQGHKEAQANPADFDGILAGAPAFNWTKFITTELYPQVVVQRDLGGTPLTPAQLNQVSRAAIVACDSVGGEHLGFIPDPSICRYDAITDPAVLCPADNGVNTTPDCVSRVQATAINKMWYGQTADGSVPDPTSDNGFGSNPAPGQLWYGLARGTSMAGLAGPSPFTIASDMVALELQDPTLATPSFVNATGNGANGWRNLSYQQLAQAWDQGVALQGPFANINTDNPDLDAFRARNGRMIMYHGLADTLIPPQGSINYYLRVADRLGSIAAAQSFYRFYLVPGMAHGFSNGTANPDANPPLPTIDQLYALLTNWVENGVAPERVEISSAATASAPAKSRPLCVYPQKPTYTSGDPKVTASYSCS